MVLEAWVAKTSWLWGELEGRLENSLRAGFRVGLHGQIDLVHGKKEKRAGQTSGTEDDQTVRLTWGRISRLDKWEKKAVGLELACLLVA